MNSAKQNLGEANFPGKLPQITATFWLLKITATTLGETGGDFLSLTMNAGYLLSTLFFFAFFLATLGTQLLAQSHRPYLFWAVIISTSTAGTTMSDYMDRTLGLGYGKGAAILVSILLCLLLAWRIAVGNIDVNNIKSRTGEVFYWLTILFSNTLGTALGDFLVEDSGLGFLGSWLLITGLLTLIITITRFTQVSRVALFWLAFILTRPFGATFGDLLTKTKDKGGLDLGTGYASLVLLIILLFTIRLTDRQKAKG